MSILDEYLANGVPEDELQKFLDSLAFRQTKELLVDLAIHFSEETRRIVVSRGTTVYFFEILPEDPREHARIIRIPLIPFFGMYVGYNSEVDILVFEEPRR